MLDFVLGRSFARRGIGYVVALTALVALADAHDPDAEVAGQASVDALRTEIVALRAEVRALRDAVRPPNGAA